MRSALDKPTLLIAEDDQNLRYLVAFVAKRSGEYAAVHTVGDGQAALEEIREMLHHNGELHNSLVVLSDLSMPRMDGIQLIRELKHDSATRDIPIVIMTSSNQPNDRKDALAAGCCAFYYKPERLDEYAALVASLPRVASVHAHASA